MNIQLGYVTLSGRRLGGDKDQVLRGGVLSPLLIESGSAGGGGCHLLLEGLAGENRLFAGNCGGGVVNRSVISVRGFHKGFLG